MIGGKKEGRKEDAMFGKEGEQLPGEGKMNSIIGKGCKITGTILVSEERSASTASSRARSRSRTRSSSARTAA